MGLKLIYKNDFGIVTMHGTTQGDIRICKLEGLGIALSEYTTAVYTGQKGQHTLFKRALPRSITMSLEVTGNNTASVARTAINVLSRSGTLFIEDKNIDRRIFCNQVQIPDMEKVLKGKIFTFAVQFVCDNPYFEDKTDTVLPLYQRAKMLSTPFSLPCVFGEITAGAQIENNGDMEIEPQITICYPNTIENAENATITNRTTGKSICLDYAPLAKDVVTIDVKNRKITSSINGNIINCLSDTTFLGDFVLVRGTNHITVDLGDVTSGFTIECRYSNNYQEAVIV